MEITGFRYTNRKPLRRKSRHGRFLALFFILVIIFSTAGYSITVLSRPLTPLTLLPNKLAALPAESASLPWPSVGQAAIGSDSEGVVAVSDNTGKARPIASMAKIITALAVMRERPFEKGQAGATITIGSEDIDSYYEYVRIGGSVVAVDYGEKLSQYDALQALLLPSANNIADTLARWAFGSISEYKDYANDMVKEYGLRSTTVDDASGFSARTRSTPAEMIVLGQKALENPVIAEIVSKKQATIPVAGTIKNINPLLSNKVIGIKTGNTAEAGGCLLFAAESKLDETHKITIIGVVMGEPTATQAYVSAEKLLNAAYKNFGLRTVVRAGDVVGKYESLWGETTEVIAEADLSVYGWKGWKLKPVAELPARTDPLKANEVVGRVVVEVNGVNIAAPVKARDKTATPPMLRRLQQHF